MATKKEMYWDNYLGGYVEVDLEVPDEPVGIFREGKESVRIHGKLWHTPKEVLNELDKLRNTIEHMKRDTAIMHAIHTCSMTEEERQAITYQSGPYDITKLTMGIRDFVNTLITQAGEQK